MARLTNAETRAQLDVDEASIIEVDVQCGACGEESTNKVFGDASVTSVMSALACPECGVMGRCRLIPTRALRVEEPERPPHPEEPG